MRYAFVVALQERGRKPDELTYEQIRDIGTRTTVSLMTGGNAEDWA